MPRTTRVLVALVALAAPTLVGAAGVPVVATADDASTVLPLHGFGSLVVDARHHHEFVTGSSAQDGVAVADDRGRLVRVLDVPGARGMALSADATTLYVAQPSAQSITAVNTNDLTTRTWSTGHGSAPTAVAVSQGLVWFTGEEAGGLGALDPGTGATRHVSSDSCCDLDARLLAVHGGRGDELIAYDDVVRRVVVTGGDDPTSTTTQVLETRDPSTDVAVSASGTRLLVGASILRTSDFSGADSVPRHGGVTAVAWRGDGVLATATEKGNVSIYGRGQTVVSDDVPIDHGPGSAGPGRVAPGGLGFGGDKLYAVRGWSEGGEPPGLELQVIDVRTATPPSGTRRLPFDTFGQVLGDARHDQAFVTPGTDGNGVLVLGHRGRVTRVLSHLPGASEMALSPDDETLYVALPGADSIALVNTVTFRVRRLPTGVGTAPRVVAPVAGLLWFAGDAGSRGGVFGVVDPRTGRARVLGRDAPDHLVSTPVRPHELLAGGPFEHGGYGLTRLVVRGGRSPGVVSSRAVVAPAYFEPALTPDGLHVVLSGRMYGPDQFGAYSHQVWSPTDLALDGTQVTDSSPDGQAVRGDGLTALGTGFYEDQPSPEPSRTPDVFLRRTALGDSVGGVVLPRDVSNDLRGLSFGARNLFTIAGQDGSYEARVFAMPPVRRLSVDTDKAAYEVGQTAHVVAHLHGSARRMVTIYARGHGQRHRVLVGRRRTDRFGNVSVRRRVSRRTTFTAVAHVGRHTYRARATRDVGVSPPR